MDSTSTRGEAEALVGSTSTAFGDGGNGATVPALSAAVIFDR